MKRVGYQKGTWDDLHRQTELLLNFGIEFNDIITQPRFIQGFDYFFEQINKMPKGTTIYMETMMIIAKNVSDLMCILNELEKHGIRLLSVNDGINNFTAFGKATIDILNGAYLLEYQDNSIDNSMKFIHRGFERIEKLFGKKMNEGL